MSFLDDYQVHYKLLGVRLVADMLTRVPPHLLLRTGVDTLIFNVRAILTFSLAMLKPGSVSHKFLVTPRGPLNAGLHTFSCCDHASAH